MLKFKRILYLFFLAILFAISFSFGIAVFEDAKVNQAFNDFKARANPEPVLQTEVHGVTHLYFEVPRETSRGEGNRPVFSDAAKTRPGLRGDILLTQQSPFPEAVFIDWYVGYFFGGHAALVTGPNQTIEATGMGVGFRDIFRSTFHRGYDPDGIFPRNIFRTQNAWMTGRRTPDHPMFDQHGGFSRGSFVAVRVKDDGFINENIEIAVEYAEQAFYNRALYNFIFFLNTRYRYYCTDLISRAFDQVAVQTDRRINLNTDGFITSVNDIVLSPDVYITILMETVNGVRHIYFLADPI